MMITHTYQNECMYITFVCVHKKDWDTIIEHAHEKENFETKYAKKGTSNRQIIIYYEN